MFTRTILLSCFAVAVVLARQATPIAGKRPLEGPPPRASPRATFIEAPELEVFPPFRQPPAPRRPVAVAPHHPVPHHPIPHHPVPHHPVPHHHVPHHPVPHHHVLHQSAPEPKTVNEHTGIPREWLRPALVSQAVDGLFHQNQVIPRVWHQHLSQLQHIPALLTQEGAIATREAGNANDYVDMILANLNAFLPAKFVLPDLGTPVHLTDCYTIGLDNGLHRSMDSTFATIENTIKFNGGFRMGPFGVHCHWKYLLVGGKADITTSNFDLELAMQLHIDSGETPQLTQFQVNELAKFKVDISGVPTMNWAIANVVEGIVNGYLDTIVTGIETVVPAAVQGVFDKLVLP